jgi:hypothetical protein
VDAVTEFSFMKEQPKDKRGRFTSPYDEPRSKKVIGVRLPVHVYEQLVVAASERGKTPGELMRDLTTAAFSYEKQEWQRGKVDSLSATSPAFRQKLEAVRDYILSNLRVGKQSAKYKQTRKLLEQFINLLF